MYGSHVTISRLNGQCAFAAERQMRLMVRKGQRRPDGEVLMWT